MNAFDDQYDAPLNGAERARLRALELALAHTPADIEPLLEKARAMEQFVIGQRATEVKELLEKAYVLADKLLSSSGDPWAGGGPERPDGKVEVDLVGLQELTKLLSRLTDAPPF